MLFRSFCNPLLACVLITACQPAGSDSKHDRAAALPDSAYRVMAGVSMGGYGSSYLGTKYDKLFDLVGVMGGPMDWIFLNRYIETNLMGGFLDEPGLAYTYERWYPGIDAGSNSSSATNTSSSWATWPSRGATS